MLSRLMKSPAATWKSVVLTFVLAVIFYMFAWSWMAKRQTGQGPWVVDFGTNAAGGPQIVITQTARGISNVTVRFEGEQLDATNRTGRIAFKAPRTTTPFGRVVYDDLMFQPGSVAIDAFGHVVEMVPRGLGLNGKEQPWRSDVVHSLFPTNKLSLEERNKWKGGYRDASPTNSGSYRSR
jgi:hypothetical protein